MSTTTARFTSSELANPRTLISDELFDRLTARVAVEENLPDLLAERVMEQTLAFLAVCAIYLLFLRNAVMWGFLCILGIVALFVVMVSPDMLNNR